MAKSKRQDKNKGKNLVKFFLAKFKASGSGSGFLTLGARQVFTELRQTFIEVPIFYHFDLDYHIWIETNTSSFTIGRILD